MDKAPNPKFTSINLHITETMESQTQPQVVDVMETQAQVQQVEDMKVLSLEEKTLSSSSIISLANELSQSKLKDEKVLHCELDVNKYICVFNNLISDEL